MIQYQNQLTEVMTYGKVREDRTGVGTISLFSPKEAHYDLSEGFPLVTTKKMFINGVINELLWFISGSTNYKDLPSNTHQWWEPWANDDGSLGPIYGSQYTQSRWWFETEPKIYTPHTVYKSDDRFCGVGVIGDTSSLRNQSTEMKLLKNTWRDLIKRCYDENSKAYASYGAKGVHMEPRWLVYDNFAEDAIKLPNWHLKITYPEEYSLDKDILFASNRYSKETCMWASHVEQSANTSTNMPFTAKSPEGVEILFSSIGEMQRRFGVNLSAVHRCLKGHLKTHRDWSEFKYVQSSKVMRFRELNQIKNLIAEIKTNPYSRRHMINLWHTPAMQHANLPCCHGSIIQFYVEDDKLSCKAYQRSADMFLGVPVNIASYALLTHMLAAQTGYKPGKFIHSIGDAHIYKNHITQVSTILRRVPEDLPTLTLDPTVKSIFHYTMDHIKIEGYHPYPAIKGDVAV